MSKAINYMVFGAFLGICAMEASKSKKVKKLLNNIKM